MFFHYLLIFSPFFQSLLRLIEFVCNWVCATGSVCNRIGAQSDPCVIGSVCNRVRVQSGPCAIGSVCNWVRVVILVRALMLGGRLSHPAETACCVLCVASYHASHIPLRFYRQLRFFFCHFILTYFGGFRFCASWFVCVRTKTPQSWGHEKSLVSYFSTAFWSCSVLWKGSNGP